MIRNKTSNEIQAMFNISYESNMNQKREDDNIARLTETGISNNATVLSEMKLIR